MDNEKNKGFMSYLRTVLRLRKRVRSNANSNGEGRNYQLLDVGFHGDRYLLDVVAAIARVCNCFIETGSNVGSTLAYMGRTYPHLECLSCEPDPAAFGHALRNIEGLSHVKVFNETSQELLHRIQKEHKEMFSKNVLFWLDAHGYGFQWPLKDELSFITRHFASAYILIDDFKVPGLDCFGYDVDRGQECSFDYTKDSLNPDLQYSLHYPAYTERTSTHHPLQGWGLIEYGHGVLNFPGSLNGKIKSHHRIKTNTEG